MSLLPLALSVGEQRFSVVSPAGEAPTWSAIPCRYCGAPGGYTPATLALESEKTCALCGMVRHLERPQISEEACLVWLPEMSQAALNVLMRRIHCGLRSLGERLEAGAVPALAVGDRTLLYHAQRACLDRAREAELRLGTSDPANLADALTRLSAGAFTRRGALLGGLRLLTMGRLFEGGADIYPRVVDSWRQSAGSPLDTRTSAALPGGGVV